jgi:predicted polyphosphate/ATP-dependent NAD kinase
VAARLKLGVVVNPIAGMGGRLALKGSDDRSLLRGAAPVAPARAVEALRSLAGVEVFAYAGAMGADEAREAGLDPTVVGSVGATTTAVDTRAAAAAMADRAVDLLLFAGGDGTAVDVFEAIGDRLPVLGVPAGVKMHSAVFAVNPRSAGELVARAARDGLRGLRRAEVMDVDEALLRAGSVSARLHGYMNVPAERRLVQSAKARSLAAEAEAQEAIAHHLAENVLADRTWLVGPGTTTAALMNLLGLEKTLLGVDVIRDGKLVVADADERTLLEVADAGIVVTPVGGQGFVFGRGNQQLSAPVIRRADRIVVVATEAKIAGLAGAPLRVDTGDPELDSSLAGWTRVTVGFNREIVYRIQ